MEENKKPNDIVTPQLLEKAQRIIAQNAQYCNLKKQLDKAVRQRNYVMQMQLQQKVESIEKEIIQKLVEQEIEELQKTNAILKMMSIEDALKYRDYLNALCFCFDTIDFIITDVNDLLKRNDIKFNVESIPEIKKCKEKVASVVNIDIRQMDEKELELYYNEADSIFAHLVKRGGVFRKKVDSYKAKARKGSQKA